MRWQANLISNHGVREYQIMVSESFGFTGPFICWIAWTELSDLPWTFLLLGMVIWIIIFSFKQGRKIVDFMEYSRYFQKPKPSYPSHANSETKKVHLNSSTQAKLSLRSSTVRCSSAALSSDYITRPVALVQHCSSRGAAQRSSRCAAAAGRLRSISLVCVLHNTITLTLTAVRPVKQIHSLYRVNIHSFTQECGKSSSSSIDSFKFLPRNHQL